LFDQAQQSAACNASHKVEARIRSTMRSFPIKAKSRQAI
jgi:hypothetical protein